MKSSITHNFNPEIKHLQELRGINPKNKATSRIFRRHPDSNWGIKDLQSSALPLGYAAILNFFSNRLLRQFYCKKSKKTSLKINKFLTFLEFPMRKFQETLNKKFLSYLKEPIC